MIENPFVTNGYAGPEYFCDRIEETALLSNLLTNGNDVALMSPRRVGKTDLVKHCFQQDSIREDNYCFLIDIYATNSFRDFVNVFGKSILDTRAVDKMENSIQNIILQEMENLDGIMIATTNLQQNLDTAFERRFLYKIKFEKPDATIRQHLWQSMMPSLSEADAQTLASNYDFSGGQIENISRKATINAILYGNEANSIERLNDFCNAECLEGATRKIGF